MSMMKRCDCGHHYETGEGWWASCPRCNPGQPRPIEVRRRDVTEFLGPEWIWIDHAGPIGMWCHREEFVVLSREEGDALSALALSVAKPGDQGRRMSAILADAIRSATGQDVPVNEATRVRYSDLADRLQRAEDNLRRVRADRDRLRDEVEEMRARSRTR